MTVDKERQRVFLAVWPDDGVRAGLAQWARQCHTRTGGRLVAAENLHATLVFLGELGTPQREAISACAASVPVPDVVLRLDRLGHWSRSGIVWAGARNLPASFGDFVAGLRERLARLGFPVDRRPYVLHVTLIRRAERRPRLQVAPLAWHCREFTLVSSTLAPTGSRYQVLRRWSAPGDMK